MSLIRLGFWAASGSGGVNYWLASIGGTGDDIGQSLDFDSDKNSYSFGYTDSYGSGLDDLLLVKRDLEGAVQWQRSLGGLSNDQGQAIAIDSSNNIYVAGNTKSDGPGNDALTLAKYNTSGTIQFQRALGGSDGEQANAIAIDSSGSVYVAGITTSQGEGSYDILLAKYNNLGTLQWQRILGGTGVEWASGLSIDSEDNVYVAGWTTSQGQGGDDALLAKYNSSGTIQWQRILGGTGTDDNGASIVFDSSNNVYVGGRTDSEGQGSRDFLLIKYNSAGVLQWQKIFGGTGNDQGLSIAIDSSDYVYMTGRFSSSGEGSNDFPIVKFNSSGVLQFQRTLGGTGNDFALSIAINSGAIHVLGYSDSTGEGLNDMLLAKLPQDGSLTGTYILDGVNIVYAASSLTAATSTLTAATSTLTAATSSLTSETTTLTAATPTLTSHFVEIPA